MTAKELSIFPVRSQVNRDLQPLNEVIMQYCKGSTSDRTDVRISVVT